MQQPQKNTAHRKKRNADTLNFDFKTEKNPLKIWLKVGCMLWPVVSILFNIIPFLKKIIINKFLGKAEDVYGKVESIRLEVWQPGCVIKDIHFKQVSAPGDHTLKCSAELIKVSFDRKALWNGIVSCDAIVHRFIFSFVKNKKSAHKDEGKDKPKPRKKFKIPVPVIIRQFNIIDSKIEYTDTTLPKVKVNTVITNIRVRITNLATLRSYDELPAKAFLRANVYNGVLNAHLKANVLEPAFDLDAELTGVNMVKLNEFFQAYGNFDVNDGTLSFFTEVAAKDGQYKGYVKPVIQNLDIAGMEGKQESFLHQLWEKFVGAAVAVITNQRDDQLATKIPFEGELTPHIHIAYAIIETLVNAFVNALKPSIDNEINIGSVKRR